MNIALQIERSTAGTVTSGANVIFDNTVYTTGNINYNPVTGIITFNEAGRYLINWWVATQSSRSSNGIVFSLVSSQANELEGNMPTKTGEVYGVGIIDVVTAPVTVSLINRSTNIVYYAAQGPLSATLVVVSHDFGLTGPTGPTGDTGPTGPTGPSTLTNLIDGNVTGAVRGIAVATTYTMGEYAVALGRLTQATGLASHAEGQGTIASHYYAHAEGSLSAATGLASHAEGQDTIASYASAHAEGILTTASGRSAHAEGQETTSSGVGTHAEGTSTTASGIASHAEGSWTRANGLYSHAEGTRTSAASHEGAHIMGQYGEADTDYSWFLAGGTGLTDLQLKCKILQDGNAYIDGAWNASPADYAEMFETSDGQPIEPGYFVTIDGASNKIRKAVSSDEYILGIVSATPAFVGNTAELRWKNKYLTDKWGQIQYHEVTISEQKDANGNVIIPAHIQTQPILNPKWDATQTYVSRTKRPEWVTVGMMGQLLLRDDGTCQIGGYCRPTDGGIATASEKGYRVIGRLEEHQILIIRLGGGI